MSSDRRAFADERQGTLCLHQKALFAYPAVLWGGISALFMRNTYVLGLTTGRFPVMQDESPVLNDKEREQLFGNRDHCSDAIERRKLTDLVRTVLMAEREPCCKL